MPFNPYDLKIEPRFDPQRKVERFETSTQVEGKEDYYLRTLRAGNSESRTLADMLENSWRGDPKLSPAKVSDLSAYRRWLGSEAIRLHESNSHARTANFTPHWWQRPKGELCGFNLRRELKAEKKKFERDLSPDIKLIMGIDLSANTDSKRPGEVFWQPHMHGVMFAPSKNDIQVLRRRYPLRPDMTIERPVRFDAIDNPANQLSYILKINFKRWKPTYDRRHPLDWRDNLLADEVRELLLFLDQYELRDLVLMHGVRRFGSELRFT